ncbi:hypothetical protein C8F04DRAFT_305555 [Mycena alexandri]|uniref:DRBM domain-containing protein n=1 Tax=Mycena alexandri TaxID=1745969 RepID=A0AAD6T502_9AGAR|nr:hypothetical protein C8F04DRAFT_305555 [Mycena alexandri]
MSSLRESNGAGISSSMPASPSTPGTTGGTSAPQSPTNSLTRFNEAVQKAGRRADWVYGRDASGSTSAQGKAKAAWTVEVLVDGEVFGRGEGSTKKAARNEAAKQALLRL